MKVIRLRHVAIASALALGAAAIVVGANALTESAIAANQGAIEATVEAAVLATLETNARQVPTLLTPTENDSFDNAAAVTLEWTWYRKLEDDEYYDLSVWREGEEAAGITWTKDDKFDLRDWLLYQQPGEYQWSVTVIKPGADDEPILKVSEPAPPQHFTVSTIDMQIMNLPAGFTAAYYARLPFKQPSVITFGPNGGLYALSVEGNIARLTDADSDGFAENVEVVYTDAENRLDHAVGMAFYEGRLYISDSGRVSTITDTDDDGILDTITPVIEGLPSLWYTFHSNNGIAFGSDGKLYIAVGSTTDHGPLQTPMEASILRANPDGSELEVFASGFRNPYDLVFTPQGELFTADNSPDGLDETLAYLPPEELNYVQEGGNYGFPEEFGFPDSASDTLPPVTELFTSSASSGITYLDEDSFPPEYRGIFLAQFGTGADAPTSAGVHSGRQVVYISLTANGSGGYSGTWKPFAVFRTDLADTYTPIDVTVGGDGALYIAEWTSATIYRVTYSGENDGEPETATEISGERLYSQGVAGAPACISCHQMSEGDSTVAPSLIGLAERAETQETGLSAEAYIRQSILEPDAYIVSGYNGGLMYQHYAEKLTAEQVDALVRYLLEL